MAPCLTWLPLAVLPLAFASPPQAPGEDLQEAQKEILQKWQEGREKLKSGKVLLVIENDLEKPRLTETIQYEFDLGLRSNKGITSVQGKTKGMWAYNLLHTASCSLDHPNRPTLIILPPNSKGLPNAKPLDPGLLGNMILADYSKFPNRAELLSILSRFHTTSVKNLDADRIQITLEAQGEKTIQNRLICIINRTHDYTWESQEYYFKIQDHKDWFLDSSTQTTWVQMDGVYVPSQVRCEGMAKATTTIQCTWEKINPKYLPRDFDYTTLPLPKNATVHDERTNKGIGVIPEVIGRKFIQSLLPK